jgi:hypothetical protein
MKNSSLSVLLALFVLSGLIFSACDSEDVIADPEPSAPSAVIESVNEDAPERELPIEAEPEATDEVVEDLAEEVVEEEESPLEEVTEEAEEVVEEAAEEVTEELSEVVEEVAEEIAEVFNYADGTYSHTGAYTSPAGQEFIGLTFVIESDTIASVSATPQAEHATSRQYQELFASGLSSLVNGVKLDSMQNLGAVNGSSLTPKAFNSVLMELKGSAAL